VRLFMVWIRCVPWIFGHFSHGCTERRHKYAQSFQRWESSSDVPSLDEQYHCSGTVAYGDALDTVVVDFIGEFMHMASER
jgi:hypothetical protein